MKKIIYKILKKILKNKEVYEFFVKELVDENRIEFIEELIKYPVFINISRENCELEEINNCILINSSFKDCKIKSITNNSMRNAYIANNYINNDALN